MASFLSTLFGGGAEAEAAAKNRALYQNYQTQGLGALDTGMTQATGTLQNNQTAGLAALRDNQAAGTAALQAGQAGALGAWDTAGGYYAPLAQKYGTATGLGLDALGANGAAGNDRATSAFHAGPGYQFALDQALDAINRKANASGALLGGNTLSALSDRAVGMANQEYGSWVDRLNNYVNPEMQATAGMANAAGNKAGVYTGTADSIAGLGNATTSGTLGLNNSTAGALAGLYSNDATNRVGLYGNTTSGMASANNTEAAGAAAGAKNLLGAGLGLASIMAGGPMGGTSLLGGGMKAANLATGGPSGYGGGTGFLNSLFGR